MKEQREKKAMINKIVYFTLTSAAEAPMGIVIRKAGLPPLFFSFLLCFLFPLPLLARLAPLWWSCRSSEGYHPNTEQHGKSKLWLVSGDGRVAVAAPDVCLCSGVLSQSVAKKKWSEICSVVFTSHQIASPPSFLHADRNVCFSEKAQGLVKLQGGLQTNDLIQASCACWSTPTPRKSDNKGLGFQQGGTRQHVAPHVGSV